MKLKLLVLALLAFSPCLYSQQKMIVFFDEKSEEIELTQFSERSLERRSKRSVEFDDNDKPINAEYLALLTMDGKILNSSRWLNAVSYSTELSSDELLAKYNFIERIKVVSDAKPRGVDKFENATKSLAYGQGFSQVNQLNLKCLHDMGYTGTGVYMAIIDAGFENMLQIDYFDTLYNENRVIDQHNFVTGGVQVYNASGHGTSVASCVVGEKGPPGQFAGTAVDVDLALYLSEDVGSETEIEEFNLVAALERCDSVGADIANISLGYVDFDDSLTDHVYADLDGNTTIAAMGVNVAVSKGIAVVMAAGNDGPGPATLSTPCDADDGLCVGAVDEFGGYAFFSSVGPAFDGAVKPNVVARGQDTWVVITSGILEPGNGTSFASPVMAGATACLIQAHPTKTVAEIFEAIEMSANQYTNPDEYMGHGIPDMCVANDILNSASVDELTDESLQVYPNPGNEYIHVELSNSSEEVELVLLNALGEIVKKNDGTNTFDVRDLNDGLYTVQVRGDHIVLHKQLMIIH